VGDANTKTILIDFREAILVGRDLGGHRGANNLTGPSFIPGNHWGQW